MRKVVSAVMFVALFAAALPNAFSESAVDSVQSNANIKACRDSGGRYLLGSAFPACSCPEGKVNNWNAPSKKTDDPNARKADICVPVVKKEIKPDKKAKAPAEPAIPLKCAPASERVEALSSKAASNNVVCTGTDVKSITKLVISCDNCTPTTAEVRPRPEGNTITQPVSVTWPTPKAGGFSKVTVTAVRGRGPIVTSFDVAWKQTPCAISGGEDLNDGCVCAKEKGLKLSADGKTCDKVVEKSEAQKACEGPDGKQGTWMKDGTCVCANGLLPVSENGMTVCRKPAAPPTVVEKNRLATIPMHLKLMLDGGFYRGLDYSSGTAGFISAGASWVPNRYFELGGMGGVGYDHARGINKLGGVETHSMGAKFSLGAIVWPSEYFGISGDITYMPMGIVGGTDYLHSLLGFSPGILGRIPINDLTAMEIGFQGLIGKITAREFIGGPVKSGVGGGILLFARLSLFGYGR